MELYRVLRSQFEMVIILCIFNVNLRMVIGNIDVENNANFPMENGNIANDVEEQLCNLVPKDVVLERASRNHGFHRVITTVLNITFEDKIACSTCWLMLVELIPNGMYVDVYQTKEDESFGGPQVLSPTVIDIEKPAYQSPEHTVLVYIPHPLSVTDGMAEHTIQVELPVHLRYHRPSRDASITSALVQLQYPNMMMRCIGSTSGDDVQPYDLYQAPCTSQNISMCAWKDVKYTQVNKQPLHFLVPVGQESHTVLVTVLTIAATITGTIWLLWVIFPTPEHKTKVT